MPTDRPHADTRRAQPTAATLGRVNRGLAAALVAVLAGWSGQGAAQDTPREFADWLRPASTPERRSPVLPPEWARLQRPPDRFAPPQPSADNLALVAAAGAARWPEVVTLLKGGAARARSADTSSANALSLAVIAGESEVVREFISRGDDLERIGDNGMTPLGAAAFNGQVAMLRQLARAGADLHRWGTTGQTPLHLASLTGRAAVVAQLLKLHADPERLNRGRETAIDVAASNGHADALDLLLAAGADTSLAGRR